LCVAILTKGLTFAQQFCITVFLIPPAICMLKYATQVILGKSKSKLKLLLVAFYFGLAGWATYAIYKAIKEEEPDKTKEALKVWVYAWLIGMAAEVPTLIWQYFFCRACCPCCIPPQDEAEDDNKSPK